MLHTLYIVYLIPCLIMAKPRRSEARKPCEQSFTLQPPAIILSVYGTCVGTLNARV